MESIDRAALAQRIYDALGTRFRNGQLDERQLDAVIADAADGYPFPTNLDTDPPSGGLAPQTQQLLRLAVHESWAAERFNNALLEQKAKRKA